MTQSSLPMAPEVVQSGIADRPASEGRAAILIVDDDEPIRRMLGRLLEEHGHRCTLAVDAHDARRHLDTTEYALILCDVNMPGESGLDLIRHVLQDHPHTAAVMVTGLDDPHLASVALDFGAYGYLVKPCKANEVLINVANALHRRRLEIDNQAHRERLEQMVLARTRALRQAIERLKHAEQDLRHSREETIQRLALAAEFRDHVTAQHLRRMSHYCALLARRYGLDEERCELIRIASPMHDIGKIGTPDHVLLKPDKLTAEDYEIMTHHPDTGYRILSGSDSELLNVAATIAWTHHEKFDGSGYPRGLAGDAIPVEGRIAAIGDTFDALTSRRLYKPAFSIAQAVDLMGQGRGRHFDPGLLDLFLNGKGTDEVLAIRNRYADPTTNLDLGRVLHG